MRFNLPKSHARPTWLRILGLITVSAVLLAGGAALAQPYLGLASVGAQESEGENFVPKTDGPVTPVILIRCYESGFVIPEGIEDLPSGDYTVVIRNRSGFDSPLGIEFSRKGETPAVSKALPWGQDLVFTITLDSGAFEIKETSRPEWARELSVGG